ncbi:UDP-Glycosyltransferase/glycogen phosphorylase [Gloeophyllum trabeum ATCC 11539]|uniref:GDP-Man:Man(3)GlcNAc(2)-PP-Dol alpha-1,2-mannosyltransferase n=1 Tax=Gloeophyllum trabeum (strain ATCC 11539 / FP-39264 / Madison 617) TaxID=670483 RepID=S7Q491_GLOTA|nr:UDP-Glycosyltransferase/glycogen phosphorylase [Gloeophyllum trabeum ATCC 11539]EPQ54836.1 UDP-Glycosyltransferase/glycogen phosphorylase [Gloeophyllum trabeum ATCC 11539]
MNSPLLALWFLLFAPFLYAWRRIKQVRRQQRQNRTKLLDELGVTLADAHRKRVVGFFHPYCNAGGGGERVLWTAIEHMQRTERDVVCAVYSGDTDATKASIIEKVKARFDISLAPDSLAFVFLNSRHLVEDSTWPRFTLLGQSLGSMYMAWEAMGKLIPDLFIDTMGYAFTFHVVRWIGRVPIGAYVHYPTISTDMLARVRARQRWHTNADTISASRVLSLGKVLYYRIFMYHYSRSLRLASFVMVNSSWTKNHVDAILRHSDPLLDALHTLPPWSLLNWISPANADSPRDARIVYPPCDTREVAQFPLQGRERVILSLAQFRPEKDHAAQLHAFSILLDAHPEFKSSGASPIRLVLVGSSRNAEDAARVDSLRALATALDIADQVEFVLNAPFATVLHWLSRASVGLSTMVDEHFGINVVEFMAAGVIPVTHASGGPLNDIVVPFNGEPTGYHATTPESFAEALYSAFTLAPEQELAMRERARTWAVQRFSEEEFEKGWDASGWRTWLEAGS